MNSTGLRPPSDEVTPLPIWLWRRFVAVFATTALFALADGLWIAVRAQPTWGLVGRYSILGMGIGAWLAILAALLLTPGHMLGRAVNSLLPQRWAREVLRGLGYTLFALCGAAVLLRPWELANDSRTYRPILALIVAVTLSALALSVLWARATKWTILAAAVLAVSCAIGDATVLISVYPRWHDAAAWFGLLLGGVAINGLLRGASLRLLQALSLAALLLQTSWWVSAREVVEIGAERGVVVPKLVVLGRWFTDRDGDRFSSVLSGGDCNDANDTVYPGQCEIAGNGVDENCNGLDGAPETAEYGARAVGGETAAATSLRIAPPDLYFVLLDGARADLAGAQRSQLTPEIERFARTALDFRHAYTTYPSTFRAIVTLQTSRYWRYLGPGHELFAIRLARAGWNAQLLIRDRVLTDFPRLFHLARKDDPFHTRSPGKSSWTQLTIDHAISEMAQVDAPPRLRWVHLLDTHAPWVHGVESTSPRQQYQAELVHSSQHFGRLIDALEASERGRRAVVVLLADHGTALGEHGAGTHGGTLYEELIRVPLLMRLPQVAPRSIDGLTSLLDIVPTLATYLGIPVDPGWQGFSWLTCDAQVCDILPQGPTARVVAHLQASAGWGYSGLPALDAASDGRYKLLVDLDRGRRMFFDLQQDPGETRPVVEPPPNVLQRLEKALSNWEDQPGCANRL